METVASPGAMILRDRRRDRALIRQWLILVAAMIVAIVVVGGATRITDSGLSITEWQPIHGVVPPLNDAEWQEEFAKYQTTPQFQILNPDMGIDAFKGIFWWEYAHRLLGRLIGVVVLLPLLALWVSGRIERRLLPHLVAILLLVGLQGVIGWWMVASGLVERTDVSQYRLAIHLTLAMFILGYVTWVARGLSEAPDKAASDGMRATAWLIVALVFLQVFLGGLVAGTNAGLSFNTWPLMDGSFAPSNLFAAVPWWANLFENVATVQFNHRVVAYLVFVVAGAHAFHARRTPFGRSAAVLLLLVTLQAAIGVLALVLAVPFPLALLHQLGAAALVVVAVGHARAMSPASAQEELVGRA